MKDDTIFLKCVCGTEVVDCFEAIDFDDDGDCIVMSFYASQYGNKQSNFWHGLGRRIKASLFYLFKGFYRHEELVLKKEDVIKFRDFMNKYIGE